MRPTPLGYFTWRKSFNSCIFNSKGHFLVITCSTLDGEYYLKFVVLPKPYWILQCDMGRVNHFLMGISSYLLVVSIFCSVITFGLGLLFDVILVWCCWVLATTQFLHSLDTLLSSTWSACWKQRTKMGKCKQHLLNCSCSTLFQETFGDVTQTVWALVLFNIGFHTCQHGKFELSSVMDGNSIVILWSFGGYNNQFFMSNKYHTVNAIAIVCFNEKH